MKEESNSEGNFEAFVRGFEEENRPKVIGGPKDSPVTQALEEIRRKQVETPSNWTREDYKREVSTRLEDIDKIAGTSGPFERVYAALFLPFNHLKSLLNQAEEEEIALPKELRVKANEVIGKYSFPSHFIERAGGKGYWFIRECYEEITGKKLESK